MATWFSYQPCADIEATHRFHGTLVGLAEVWHDADSVAFVHDGLQLSFHRTPDLAPEQEWAFQPGWALGQLPDAPATSRAASTSIALSPDAFRAAVARLQQSDAETLRSEPFWVGYWSFVVRDPDGRTVEISDPVTPQG